MTAIYFTGQAVDLLQQAIEVQLTLEASKAPKCSVPSNFIALAGFRIALFTEPSEEGSAGPYAIFTYCRHPSLRFSGFRVLFG